MTTAAVRLQEELAQVAAGTRSQVSYETQEYAEREASHQRRMAEAENRRIAEAQEWAAEQMVEASQQALQIQYESARRAEAHQQEMERVGRERNEVLARAASEKLRFEEAAHAELVRTQQEQRERDLEERRCQSSPTYHAVKKLRELRRLERWVAEENELEVLLTPAVDLRADLLVHIQRSEADARAKSIAAAAAAAIEFERAEAEVRARVARSTALVREDLRKAEALMAATRMQVTQNEATRTWNPSTWFGASAKRRATLRKQLGEQLAANEMAVLLQLQRLKSLSQQGSNEVVSKAAKIPSH